MPYLIAFLGILGASPRPHALPDLLEMMQAAATVEGGQLTERQLDAITQAKGRLSRAEPRRMNGGMTPPSSHRLDQRLVDLGLAESRSRAQALIKAGAVRVDGAAARKPSQPVAEGAEIAVDRAALPWVSRAALKLVHALDAFGLDPAGAVALDIGASTGGFTEVLLARGAAQVYALDVGRGQLHPKLAGDPRVISLEGVNARAIPPGLVPPVDWVISDVSFISLDKALPGPLALAKPGAILVALIKPQFEAGPSHVGKGGIVKAPAVHEAVRARIRGFLEGVGWRVIGEAESPITGGDGNREFLIAARKGAA